VAPFFLVGPIRAMVRHMAERLTESPVMTSMWSQRSRRVAKGSSSRSSSKSLMALSSGFGADPGLFFGARDSPPLAFVRVSLERGEAHGEGKGRLSLGHAAFYRGDYPLPEVFRVTAHATIFSSVHSRCNAL
jgi:hypothetical protein